MLPPRNILRRLAYGASIVSVVVVIDRWFQGKWTWTVWSALTFVAIYVPISYAADWIEARLKKSRKPKRDTI